MYAIALFVSIRFNNQCFIQFIGTYVQELHKNQIKNDEPQLYTCTIKDGKERGEIHSGC